MDLTASFISRVLNGAYPMVDSIASTWPRGFWKFKYGPLDSHGYGPTSLNQPALMFSRSDKWRIFLARPYDKLCKFGHGNCAWKSNVMPSSRACNHRGHRRSINCRFRPISGGVRSSCTPAYSSGPASEYTPYSCNVKLHRSVNHALLSTSSNVNVEHN
jgi:hypothetical protein